MTAHISPADWQKLAGRLDLSKITEAPKRASKKTKSIAKQNKAPETDVLPAVRSPRRIFGAIPGKPIGKPRMTRRDKWKKRPCVVAYRDWADKARAVMGEIPPANAVDEIRVTAYFEPPESWSEKRRTAIIGQKHRVKPDIDNVEKAILDALFKQDSAIADIVARKRWDWESRLEIEILLTPSEN